MSVRVMPMLPGALGAFKIDTRHARRQCAAPSTKRNARRGAGR